jgi:hypothetical protein
MDSLIPSAPFDETLAIAHRVEGVLSNRGMSTVLYLLKFRNFDK